MNKLLVLALMIAVLFSFGCATNPRVFMIDAKVYKLSMDEIAKMNEATAEIPDNKLDTEKEIYTCEINIKEIHNAGSENERTEVVCAPKLTFYKGEKANVTVAENNENGIFAEVIVDDTEGKDEANVEVYVKEDGETIASSKMTLEPENK